MSYSVGDGMRTLALAAGIVGYVIPRIKQGKPQGSGSK